MAFIKYPKHPKLDNPKSYAKSYKGTPLAKLDKALIAENLKAELDSQLALAKASKEAKSDLGFLLITTLVLTIAVATIATLLPDILASYMLGGM